MSWKDASEWCRSQNKILPTFNARAEVLEFLGHIFRQGCNDPWGGPGYACSFEELAVYINLITQVEDYNTHCIIEYYGLGINQLKHKEYGHLVYICGTG